MNIGMYRSQTGNKLSRSSKKNSSERKSRRCLLCLRYMLVMSLIVISGSLPVFAGTENGPQELPAEVEQPLETSTAADPCDLPVFEVSRFEISFQPQGHPGHPSLEELLNLEVELLRVKDGYTAPREGLPTVKIRLSDAGKLPVNRFYASALFRVSQRIVEYINNIGIIVVYVPVCENDIEVYTDPVTRKTELTDLRTEKQKKTARPATFTVYTGVVTGVRTAASGERITEENRINNPKHERIKTKSPIAPFDEAAATERKDLVRKDLLDAYIFRLNRHPGRKVDIALSSAAKAGDVALDYLITENKPWLVYAQMSNTGTEETDEWRERFGLAHNQVTGNDDIFTLDYITTGFDETHSVIGSYDAPLFDLEGMRWRVFGTWGQFDASEVGFADEEFHSDEWTAGGELVKNIFQHNELFLDLFAGVRWRNICVENEVSQIKGESDFFLPSAGLRLERLTATARTFGQIEYEQNLPGMADTAKGEELEAMGRLYTDDDWSVLKCNFIHSFYLEPILSPKAWEDIKTEKSSTMAHEISLMFRSQYSLDHRLIPQAVGVVGGFYSVRGYPESTANGDSTLVASAEYRFHLPRTFQVERQPGTLFGKTFRWAPQQLYSRPDWDLIFRTFIDFGRTDITDREPSYENNQQLLGTGVGVELQFTRHLNLRVDWGVALDDVQSGNENINRGDSRIHFVGTVLF